MEPIPQGGDGVDIVIVLVVPIASILPLGLPSLGVVCDACVLVFVQALAARPT
jgi:hypothetical protein